MEALAFSAIGYIVKAIKSSKTGKIVADEMSTAIWDWVRPIFLKDDENLVEEIEKNPDNEDILTEAKLKIKRKAKNDVDFAKKLEELVSRAKKTGEEEAKITIIQHNVYGDNIGRDKNIK